MTDTNGTTDALESATTSTALRGDACPIWCGGEHQIQRGHYDGGSVVHPDDAGVFHHSPSVDLWHPLSGEDGGRAGDSINVRVEGKRHDNGEDWPDVVTASNVAPGWASSVELQVEDARRLGQALLLACDLAESTQ